MFVRVLSHTNSEWNRSKSERELRRQRSSSRRRCNDREQPEYLAHLAQHRAACRHGSVSPRPRTPQLRMSAGDLAKAAAEERRQLHRPDSAPPPLQPGQRMPGECRLTVEVPEGPEQDEEGRLHTSTSMTSLNIRMRKRIHRMKSELD